MIRTLTALSLSALCASALAAQPSICNTIANLNAPITAKLAQAYVGQTANIAQCQASVNSLATPQLNAQATARYASNLSQLSYWLGYFANGGQLVKAQSSDSPFSNGFTPSPAPQARVQLTAPQTNAYTAPAKKQQQQTNTVKTKIRWF